MFHSDFRFYNKILRVAAKTQVVSGKQKHTFFFGLSTKTNLFDVYITLVPTVNAALILIRSK